MTRTLAFVASTIMLTTVANAAEPRYDHNLEEAAVRIAVAKMGAIRGGFSFRDKPKFVVVQDTSGLSAGRVEPDAPRDDGLVPAVEGSPFRLVN